MATNIRIPNDPLKELEKMGKESGIGKIPIKRLKEIIMEEAIKAAMSNLKD